MSAPPLLAVEGLQVAYGTGRARRIVVDGVSFHVAAGESVGLVGESGSGKSSIARAVLRLVPAQGSVRFEGQELLGLDAVRLRGLRARLQVVFQDPLSALDPLMTLGESIGEPLREFQPGLAPAERTAAVHAMMARVGLDAALHARHPHEVSGGQAQRAAIARALLAGPRLLVCDEPVAALDVSIKSQVGNLLRALQRELGLAMLYISHDLATLRHACDRVLVLYRGQLVEAASCEDFFRGPRHPYARALLDALPVPEPGRAVAAPAPPAGIADTGAGCRFVARCPVAQPRCAADAPALRPIATRLVACHLAEG